MGKVESTIRSEILRLAKKEVRAAFIPLKRDVRTMKLKLSGLKKNFIVLDRVAREKIREDDSRKLRLEATPEEVKASRFTPQRIRLLRNRLGISQRELAVLTGVTIGAVGAWEKGKFEPKMDKKAILIALRKLKKRGVKKVLADKAAADQKDKPSPQRKKVSKTRAARKKSARPRKGRKS